ncbi:hypothetical protein D3C84_557970 [compost metagenome]
MRHSRQPAVIHLTTERIEIRMVAPTCVAHVQHKEPALIVAGRGNPIRVTRHQHMQAVFGGDCINPLLLDGDLRLSDDLLKHGFGSLRARVECLVGEQERC